MPNGGSCRLCTSSNLDERIASGSLPEQCPCSHSFSWTNCRHISFFVFLVWLEVSPSNSTSSFLPVFPFVLFFLISGHSAFSFLLLFPLSQISCQSFFHVLCGLPACWLCHSPSYPPSPSSLFAVLMLPSRVTAPESTCSHSSLPSRHVFPSSLTIKLSNSTCKLPGKDLCGCLSLLH